MLCALGAFTDYQAEPKCSRASFDCVHRVPLHHNSGSLEEVIDLWKKNWWDAWILTSHPSMVEHWNIFVLDWIHAKLPHQ